MRKIQIYRKRLGWKILIMAGIFFWIGVIGISSSHATVREVCKVGCTYTLPSEAVAAAANNDTILIHEGTYHESATISISKTGLKILGDDPRNTTVINPTNTVFYFVSPASCEIAGLTITGGGNGIEVRSTGQITIHNNHIVSNVQSGIYGYGGTFVAYNNLILGNSGYGIVAPIAAGIETAYNNIIAKNGNWGINGFSDPSRASYNSSYSNGPSGNSNYNFSNWSVYGNISSDCLFMDEALKDFSLQETPVKSPCKDTGNPGFSDIDGTISDMGSFGGPAAAQFWPYLDVGPVITDLTVDPVIVPRGGSLSITVTGEIR